MKTSTRQTIRAVHKWIGLIGGIWIAVLGLSGLMLDHREDWGWAWRVHIPDTVLPAATVERLKTRHITLAQANPDRPEEWLAGGPNGLWYSDDGGGHWKAAGFDGRREPPMIYSILRDARQGWGKIWLASDDGLWALSPGPGPLSARRIAYPGRRITALDNGAEAGSLVLVEDRSSIHHFNVDSQREGPARPVDAVTVSGLPAQLSWSRFIFDLHLGRALFDRPLSMAINDFGALAFVLLALTGFAHWLLIKRWQGARGPSLNTRKRTFTTLYRLHAPLLGLAALLPVLYLSLTGIVMDHRDDLIGTLARNKVDRSKLPPVYGFGSLEREISHIVAYPGEPGKLTVGTRLGALTTHDGGERWRRETGQPLSPGFVWSLKRFGNDLFLGGLGGPSFVRPLDGEEWSMVPGLMGMPSDATISDEVWYVISGPSVFVGDLETGVSSQPFNVPLTSHKPLMLLMFELHNGKIFHPQFKWVLDILAVLTIIMIITGPILWWRRKWT
jgi:hypothetical protein